MGTRNVGALPGTLDAPVATNAAPLRAESKPVVTVDADVTPQTVSPAAKNTVKWACGIVLAALVLLWVFGGIVFRNANL